MNGGLVRLREIVGQLNPSERKVADYILSDPETMIQLSGAQLASRSRSSQAAIVRLCKSMGVKGFQDLKLRVAGDLREGQASGEGYREIRQNDSILTIIRNVSDNNIQSIRDTVKILDPDMMMRAVEALDRAKRIYFFGIGASNLIAHDAQQKFLRINKPSFAFADPHIQLTSAVTLTAEDAAVGISYSGETRQITASLRKAKQNGAVTIAITKYGSSSLSNLADIPLAISASENEIRSGAMSSRITQLNVVDILYLGVASRNYDNSVQYLDKTREAIKELES